jgi:hypothetical protein
VSADPVGGAGWSPGGRAWHPGGSYPGVRFQCNVLIGFETVAELLTTNEDTAIEWAKTQVSPLVTGVMIETLSDRADTFAIRHFTTAGDSGWRRWREGDFIGAGSLTTLFDPQAVS